ncbi:unnamed protein product [Paramecium sonneborni]|uniref:Uncharacterized protein n=1 Tax=Paramecium sonneborni TaxID=65129 RepID=A0A8S1PJZ3_9CILI|nr:unnamed protein product [Paramecium sonneborni]
MKRYSQIILNRPYKKQMNKNYKSDYFNEQFVFIREEQQFFYEIVTQAHNNRVFDYPAKQIDVKPICKRRYTFKMFENYILKIGRFADLHLIININLFGQNIEIQEDNFKNFKNQDNQKEIKRTGKTQNQTKKRKTNRPSYLTHSEQEQIDQQTIKSKDA